MPLKNNVFTALRYFTEKKTNMNLTVFYEHTDYTQLM